MDIGTWEATIEERLAKSVSVANESLLCCTQFQF